MKGKVFHIFPFFLFLFSCTKSPWVYREISRCDRDIQPAVLQYVSAHYFNGLQLKFLRGDDGIKGYLGVCSNATIGNENSKTLALKYSIEGNIQNDEAILLQGSQCLLLSDETTKKLLTALSDEKDCKIYFNGQAHIIPCDRFPKGFKKFCKNGFMD